MSARRGEVWLVTFDPLEGREQAGRRPALILSVDTFNAGPGELVTVLPIATRERALASRVEVRPPEGGLTKVSYIIAEQTRTVSTRRLAKRLGQVARPTITKTEDIVRTLLGL